MNELEILKANEKVSIRRLLNDNGMGSVGNCIDVSLSIVDDSGDTRISISSISNMVKKQAIRDGVDYASSNGSNDPAAYPREWLQKTLRSIVAVEVSRMCQLLVERVNLLGELK